MKSLQQFEGEFQEAANALERAGYGSGRAALYANLEPARKALKAALAREWHDIHGGAQERLRGASDVVLRGLMNVHLRFLEEHAKISEHDNDLAKIKGPFDLAVEALSEVHP